MKAVRMRALLFVAGLLLIGWSILPRQSVAVSAAPGLLITETATGEPPTPTPTSPPALQPSPTRTSTPAPSPTDTPTPVPPPPPPDSPPPPSPTPASIPALTPTTPPAPGPDPAITKSVDPPVASVGDTVTYLIAVTNLGGQVASGVVVDDTLPAFLSLVDATATRGNVVTSGRSVRVEIGDLAPGETVEVRVRATLVSAATPPDNRNLATVMSSTPDTNPGNNQASVPVDTLATPATLPNTGGEDRLPLLATLLGLALVAASLVTRRGAGRHETR